MALFIQQNEDRSKLQERLAAELRAKAKAKADIETTLPDGVEDSAYLKDTKATTGLAWIWILVVALGLVALVMAILSANS